MVLATLGSRGRLDDRVSRTASMATTPGKSRLNAAAEALGTALGRFATELESITHRGQAKDLARTVTAALERAHEYTPGETVEPSDGRIGAMAEIAHVAPQRRKSTRAATKRTTRTARPSARAGGSAKKRSARR